MRFIITIYHQVSSNIHVIIEYDIVLGKWISPNVTGDRPPPIYEFTLTSLTNDTAILFGGRTTNGDSNNVYIINFTKTSAVSIILIAII